MECKVSPLMGSWERILLHNKKGEQQQQKEPYEVKSWPTHAFSQEGKRELERG